MTTYFDLCGALRRIRRLTDMSQRELAAAAGLSASAVAHAEAGTRDLPVQRLARAAALAGIRLSLLDGDGREVLGMARDGARDLAGRLFPAHLDTRFSDEGWWHGPERYSRRQPWFTYDRNRARRDVRRDAAGTAGDHHVPGPGDSPGARKARRAVEARRRRQEEVERRLASGELQPTAEFTCGCPPECDELDDWSSAPGHAEACGCRCDVG